MESTWSQVIKTCWLADLICYWSVYSYIASAWFLTVKFSIWTTCHFWIFFGHLSFLRIFFFANVSHDTTCIPFYWFFLETFRTDVCFFSSSRCRSNLGCSLNSCTWENCHRDHSVGKEQFLRKIQGPSSKLTYPLFKAFWRWLSFSQVGYVCSQEGNSLQWHFFGAPMIKKTFSGHFYAPSHMIWGSISASLSALKFVRQFHRSNITGLAFGAFFP